MKKLFPLVLTILICSAIFAACAKAPPQGSVSAEQGSISSVLPPNSSSCGSSADGGSQGGSQSLSQGGSQGGSQSVSQSGSQGGSQSEPTPAEGSRLREAAEYVLPQDSALSYPQLVKTEFATTDNVIISANALDFGADAMGSLDSTEAIRRAVNAVSEEGGGTVFLPSGKYLITDVIEIPAYVTLRGDFASPLATRSDYGTVIVARPSALGGGAPQDKPLIKLLGNCGLVGLTFYYPEQSLSAASKYGYTVYADSAVTATMRNLTFINSSYGIGVSLGESMNELINLENVYGTFLFNAVTHNGTSDVGFFKNVVASPEFWAESALGPSPDKKEISSFTEDNLDALILGDLDDQLLSSITVLNARRGITFTRGIRPDAGFWGLVHDAQINAKVGVYADYLNSKSGVVFTASTLGTVENHSPVGAIKLAGCSAQIVGDGYTFRESQTLESDVGYKIEETGKIAFAERIVVAKGLDKTGKTDGSAELSALLSAQSAGTAVVLPNGVYRLNERIFVPRGVELTSSQGVFTRTDHYNDGNRGVVFVVYARGAAVNLGEAAGIRGIRIWHAKNDFKSAYNAINAQNAPSDSSVSGADGAYAREVESVGAYVGLDFSESDGHFIKSCYGLAYTNFIRAGGKDGVIAECLANPNFMTRTDAFKFFDESECAVASWQKMHESKESNEDFILLRDEICRRQTVMIKLIGGDGEKIYNAFCYGEAGLIDAENSVSVLAVNTSLDFIPNDKPLYRLSGGSMTVVGSLRVYGKSLSVESGRLRAYGRIGFGVLKEKAYDSELQKEDIIEYVGENAVRRTLFDCQSVSGVSGVVLSAEVVRDGRAHSWKASLSGGNAVISSAFSPIDLTRFSRGYLHAFVYADDPSAVGDGQIELSSSGTCDVNELNWSFGGAVSESGWNELWLEIRGGGSTGGTIDFSAVNFFRIYSLDTIDLYFDQIELVAD